MYNLAIRKCISPPLLAPRLKIFKLKFITRRGLNPGPAESEADMLPSEPARRVGLKYVVGGGEMRETPRKKPCQTSIRRPRNLHEVTETRTLDPSDGRRVTNLSRHGAVLV